MVVGKTQERKAKKPSKEKAPSHRPNAKSISRSQYQVELRHNGDETRKKLDDIIEHIMESGEKSLVSGADLTEICLRSREALLAEPALLRLSPPLVVIGDIHGQLADLLTIMTRVGLPPRHHYLFLGDYVDRGQFGVQVISMLLAMKLRHPDTVHLLRGNHETRLVNRRYGFFDECLAKFGVKSGLEVWTHVQHVFNCLPIAALVGSRIFCVHGGISDSLFTFDQFDRIIRPTDVTDVGLLVDLIWSDPTDKTETFMPSHRGVSSLFGKAAISAFCNHLNVDLIVRAHQCVDRGYEMFGDHLITIFSAPGYGENNAAGILRIAQDFTCQVFTYRKEKAAEKKKDPKKEKAS